MKHPEGEQIFSVEVPDDYYQKELDAYCSWRFAWGREIGQNSIDAGAKNITIRIEEAEAIKTNPDSDWTDSTCWVEWDDDGIGMDRDDGDGKLVVFSKFLVLGASQKKDGDTGGFGWAKKLICFAMIEWHIRTGTLHIHGEGGSYWVERNLERIEGTKMRIRVPAHEARIKREISKWLYWTDTKGCKVTMNGASMETFEDVPIKGVRDIPNVPWAKLTVTDTRGQKVIVRANGQMMSEMPGSQDQKHNVVIEVIGKSKDYFIANRDALRHKARQQIQSFLIRLFKNPRRITKTSTPILADFRGDSGLIQIGGLPSDDEQAAALTMALENGLSLIKILKGMSAALNLGDDGARPDTGASVWSGFNVHVRNEMDGGQIPERFIPGTWTDDSILLMAKWCAIIKFVGEAIHYHGPITPGWVFSPDILAMHHGGRIMLSPVTIDEETWEIRDRFNESSPASDWNILVEHCIHEFTHAQGHRGHGTPFICKMGQNYSMVLDNAEDLQDLRDSFYV